LQKKGVRFEWTLDCEKQFQHSNNLLASASILSIVELDEDLVVCTDSCMEGLGGVFSQNELVICYASRKLKENERYYTTHDL
jgi:hypothetical protein